MENLHSPHQQLHAVHNQHAEGQSLTTSHFEGHGSHLLHSGSAHDGNRRGSDEVSGLHQVPKGTSEPLFHHKYTKEPTSSKNNSSARLLPPFEISGDEQMKHVLENENASISERLKAAHHLVDDGVHAVVFKDRDGHRHDYQIQLFNSGRLSVKEGDNVVLGDINRGDSEGYKRITRGERERLSAEHTERLMWGSRPQSAYPHVHHRRPSGLTEIAEGQYHYQIPSGGSSIETGPEIDPHVWNGVKNGDGSVTIGFSGCAVDTDGHGASRHGEDSHRRSCTSLTRSDGRYLDTDEDNFVVLSPSVAAAYGIHIGDLGWLVRKDNGQAVPVVFGDTGHEGRRSAEASIAALKALGFNDVNGNNGVTGGRFEIVLSPGSGNGRGDIARNPQAMANLLSEHGLVATTDL